MEALGKLLEGVSSVFWPALIAVIVYCFRSQVRSGISEMIAQIRRARKLKVGILEFEHLETVAVDGQSVKERQVGRTKVRTDPATQKEIVQAHEVNRYAFLVHEYVPLDKVGKHYNVFLYVVGHFNDLSDVVKVEYFLGEGWSNDIYTSRDRSHGFAIKVQAVGSFLCMARLHFQDGNEVTQSRFVELTPLY